MMFDVKELKLKWLDSYNKHINFSITQNWNINDIENFANKKYSAKDVYKKAEELKDIKNKIKKKKSKDKPNKSKLAKLSKEKDKLYREKTKYKKSRLENFGVLSKIGNLKDQATGIVKGMINDVATGNTAKKANNLQNQQPANFAERRDIINEIARRQINR